MIVVGLGNPGPQYEETRHNVGFMILDAVVDALDLGNWKRLGDVLWLPAGRHLVVKPVGFMNTSGPALQSFVTARRVKFSGDQLLVIHDDLDFPLGTIREDRNRSSAGHQGIQSIIDTFGTEDFLRLRIGIGDNRSVGIPAENYVLEQFTAKEQPVIADAISRAVDFLRQKLG